MNKQDINLLAEHLSIYIRSSHRGYDFPSNDELINYIIDGIKNYEWQHKNQTIQIKRKKD